MDKKLKISLEIDDKAFASAVKRMQEQLSNIQSGPALLKQQQQISQKMQQLGLGPLPGAPSAQQTQQANQKAKQVSDKLFEETRRKMEIIKKLQNDLNKEQALGLDAEERKLKIQERLTELKKHEIRTTGELTAIVGSKPPGGLGSREAAGLAGGAAGLVGGIGAFIGGQARLPIEASAAAGKAATYLVGQQLMDMADPAHQAFIPERFKAMEAAKKAWKAGRVEDHMYNAAGTILAVTGLGLALEAATLGAATPFLAMAAGGTATMFGSAKQRAITGGNQQAYEQLSAQDLSDIVQQSTTAAEQANPLKKLAAEYNAQNYQRNLGIQRGLGLSDQGFMGREGFLQRNMAYGGKMQFTEEQVTQQQQAIMAAGGSARMGREAGFGLQLQKDYNLTNAPQILGGISKTMGGAGETKETTTRIIAAAFEQGLNDSDLIDLFRTFTQTTSEFISRSGARTQADADRITAQFGKGVLETTGSGMESAKTAYEAFQRTSGQTGGPLSVMQRAAMMRNPLLNRISSKGGEAGALVFEKLKQIPQGQLTEDHPAVQAAAYIYNQNLGPGEKPITAQDIVAAQTATIPFGASMSGSFMKNKAIVDKFQQSGIKVNEKNIESGKVPADVAQAFIMMGIAGTTAGVGSATELTKGQDITSYAAQFAGEMPEQYGPSEAEMTKPEKMADQVNANIATTQQAFIQNFESFKDTLVDINPQLTEANKQLILLGQIAADIAAGKKPAADMGKAASELGKTQPQADSSSAFRMPGAANRGQY